MSDRPSSTTFYKVYGRHQARPLKSHQRNLWQDSLPTFLFDHSLCHNLDFWHKKKVCLEIGFGSGEHLLGQALSHPDKLHIGCEPFINGVAAFLQQANEHDIQNILIFPADARLLLKDLPPQSLDEVVLLFADPWPKNRHHKRRFVQADQIKQIHHLLKPHGTWRIATDDAGYQSWILNHFSIPEVQALFHQKRPDIWERPDLTDWPLTRYEQKALEAGRKPLYLVYKKV
ncbi:tRNA (guanosine(46)-N7)-methyltransferase TrmB [Candidatus Finniella inopinata]|uniref:tRNA (guanine-N(7)-)-methyltransferase n=1 Tax=Candidatus Finniella inopinata TaxID=1696036 RepID=A0A4Q7DKN5_9PROT|nr:tRNA (guanosine(46)-N7)-methyltransferase TrmB [Candidatus Finniella inopinata]RZI46948.1 tRNA (guanosine(46)-N7)-methyltransferase TrmB [Candidatus Finniella inopinata]